MEEKTTDDLSQELMSKDDIDSYIKGNRFYFSDRSISELLNTLYDKRISPRPPWPARLG